MKQLLSVLLALGLVLSFSLVTAVPALAFTEVWVDDDAPSDPGPGDNTISDPLEDGSPAHPFDSIQEAISYIAVTLLDDGIVHVLEGTYDEDITLNNGVDVLGAGAAVTTIDGTGTNHVVNAGGGVGSGTVFDGFTITGGLANYGGGMYINGSSLTVSNCIFLNNQGANRGGGMYIFNPCSPLVANCVFQGNTSGNTGGAIGCRSGSTPTIINNTIVGNTANGLFILNDGGGGIFCDSTSSPTITNNIIVGNSAPNGYGGGILSRNATPPTIDYNDVYGNTAAAGDGNYGGTASAGANDISVDPNFDDPEYHIIYPASPCIDVGNNAAVATAGLTTDFEDEPRIFDGDIVPGAVVDMGADEYFVNTPPNNPTNLGPPEYVDGSTVTDDTPTLTFDQSDPDATDTVQYTIQIDNNSDFSSPTEAYTSALLAQGGASFTSSGLPDDDYYWRVMSTDQWGAASGWTYANGGAVAFHLDTSPPPPPSGTVGGTVFPVDKAALLLPWLGLGIALILAVGGLILIRRQAR
jgi:hypothetical protein